MQKEGMVFKEFCKGEQQDVIRMESKDSWRRAWNPLQYSYLENPTDRGAWRSTVHGVIQK